MAFSNRIVEMTVFPNRSFCELQLATVSTPAPLTYGQWGYVKDGPIDRWEVELAHLIACSHRSLTV
jgi:hypothetical protein